MVALLRLQFWAYGRTIQDLFGTCYSRVLVVVDRKSYTLLRTIFAELVIGLFRGRNPILFEEAVRFEEKHLLFPSPYP